MTKRFQFTLTSLLYLWVIWIFVLLSFGVVRAEELAPNDPSLVAILSARNIAEGRVSEGDHVGALDALLQSLRDAPPDRPELADAAYGTGQMVSYILLHVMPEPAAYAYLENGFQPTVYEIDKMVKVLCSIAIGLNNEDKTAQTVEAVYLTSSTNQIVRAITMFYLSNPYFYDDPAFTGQYTEMLSESYPTLELTQYSLNFPLYRDSSTEAAKENETKSYKSLSYSAWSKNLRGRIKECEENTKSKAVLTRAQAMSPLLRDVTEASDWHERHFALLLLKSEFDGPMSDEICDAARTLARSNSNTPDVLQARVLLAETLSAECVKNPDDSLALEEALSTAQTLLKIGVKETTPERVMWETWVYGIQGCARNLAAAGHVKEAAALYETLARKLPGSKISALCDEANAELFSKDPTVLEVAAE